MAINTFSTVFESRERKFQTEKIYQGEAVDLVASITTDGVPQNLTGYSIEGYYQPVEFKGTDNDRTFYEVNAEIVENKVKIHWTPDKDFGKGPYSIWALLTNGEDESYPVSWRLNLAHSPGYPAGGLPEPIPQIIDFSKYTLLNAPWVQMEDAATLIEEHIAEHNTSEDAHSDIRAAVATAQSTAESAGDDANRIAGTITTHISNTDNPHSVTASQVGADPAGTAQLLVDTHNDDLTAHPDIRQSIENMDSVCRDYIKAHNESSESHEDIRTSIANVEENLNLHVANTENPHSVKEAQVSTATTERANRSFIRADYNYAGRPQYIDAKVTDNILFQGHGGVATRFNDLFMIGKLQALYITGWGNAGGHLILEGAGTDANVLTLRTVGETNNKPGIDINPASSTTIKGDLNIASRAAVTTGSWQKTASAGDLTADGTITAKTGMKVTKTDGETTTDVMSVDSTGMKVSATSVTNEATTTGSMSVGSTGMKVSIGDGEITKDVVSVDSTGLKVDGKTTSTSVVSNSVSTNGLRVYTTGTDTSKQYLELTPGSITSLHSANLTIRGNGPSGSHNIVIGSQNYPISLRKGTTNLLVISTSGATLSVPFTAEKGATILNGITTDRAIDFTEVSTDLLNEFDIWTFGKPSYIMNVGECNGQTITFNAPYIYNQGRFDLPSVSRSSVYMFYNESSNDIVLSFELTEMVDDASDGVVFLYNDKANFFQRTIRQGCFVAVRVSIMNTGTNISGKRAYLVCAEDMGHFQDLP